MDVAHLAATLEDPSSDPLPELEAHLLFFFFLPKGLILQIISEGKIKRSLVNFVELDKTVTKMVTGCLRTMKSCHVLHLVTKKYF